MSDTDVLRHKLESLAAYVAPVDLRDRVIVGARQAARRRRMAAGGGLALVVAALVALTAVAIADRPPVQPAGPTPTVPAPTTLPPLPASDLSPAPVGAWPNTIDLVPDRSLDGQELRVPAWPAGDGCSGMATLDGGRYSRADDPAGPQLLLLKAAPISTGVVALFYCNRSVVGQQYQVVTYDRDTAGRLTLRATVLASRAGAVPAMFDVAAAQDEVRIEVGDFADPLTVSRSRHYSVRQWRAYTWNGIAYTQTGGPTAFPPNPNRYDVAVDATDLTLRAGGGSLTITVRGAASNGASVSVGLSFDLPDGLQFAVHIGCSGGTGSPPGGLVQCSAGTVAPGASVRLVLQFSGTATPGTTSRVRLTVSPEVGLGDSDPGNNSDPFTVVVKE